MFLKIWNESGFLHGCVGALEALLLIPTTQQSTREKEDGTAQNLHDVTVNSQRKVKLLRDFCRAARIASRVIGNDLSFEKP